MAEKHKSEKSINSKNGKKGKKRKINKKKCILSTTILIVLLVIIGVICYFTLNKEGKTDPGNLSVGEKEVSEGNKEKDTEENKEDSLEDVKVDIPEKMGGYDVLGEIEIPKIKVKRSIIDTATEESIEVTVAKFWGPDINEVGNFSIIGHNYIDHFKDLDKLENGDTFTITSRKGKRCTYEVFNSYVVGPKDMESIEDSLIGKREVTLITCTPSGTQRLIVKAKECKANK